MDPGWLQWFGIFIIKKIQLKFGVGMMEQARKRRNYRYIFLDNLQREGGVTSDGLTSHGRGVTVVLVISRSRNKDSRLLVDYCLTNSFLGKFCDYCNLSLFTASV